VFILHTQHNAPEYERWLREHEATMPKGTILVSGIGSFVHYGAHIDGFRLKWFQQPLSPAWTLVRDYGPLNYLPRPEHAQLWQLERTQLAAGPVVLDEREDLSSIAGMNDPGALFAAGMARYDAGDNPSARIYYRKLRGLGKPESENAAFFYAASFFREANWARARHEFKRVLRGWPQGRWIPAVHWHIATCEKNLGHNARARRLFASIVRRFPDDPNTVRMARNDLAKFSRRRSGVLVEWWRSLRGAG
jgi:hypothetical protein